MNLNTDIKEFLKHDAIDYIGFADLGNYQTELIRFGGNIVKGYPYGISIGIALPDSIVDHLPDRFDPNVACEYKTHCYTVINERLNLISSKTASFLNQKGHRTLPIAAAETTNPSDITPTVSNKMIAHIAGLGWIGKNCLLITPEHGPRVRFITLLTQAPLAVVDAPMEQRCNECMECVKICPAKAIKGVNFEMGKEREERLDALKCREYFDSLKGKIKWEVCGMCLYICPFGIKRKA